LKYYVIWHAIDGQWLACQISLVSRWRQKCKTAKSTLASILSTGTWTAFVFAAIALVSTPPLAFTLTEKLTSLVTAAASASASDQSKEKDNAPL
jgi:hypothetical protein